MPPQQLSNEGRARARRAARMIPGVAPVQDRQNALAAAQDAANRRPTEASRRAEAARVARLREARMRQERANRAARGEPY